MWKIFLISKIILLQLCSSHERWLNQYVMNRISFHLFWGNTIYDYKVINLSDGMDILRDSVFNRTRETIMYFHGLSEQPSQHRPQDSIDMLVEEFLKKPNFNLIVFDYGELTKVPNAIPFEKTILLAPEYLRAVYNVQKIGKFIGKFLQIFIPQCQCGDKLHLIGFSLGAQVCHFLSVELQKKQIKPKRITALDAAAPLYEKPFSIQTYLTKNDADYVDAIHTNPGEYGFAVSIGHSDFWPNRDSNSVQPYCLKTLNIITPKCEHYTSVYYYRESINNENNFMARQCDSDIRWQMQLCNRNEVAFMGYGLSTSANGNYYLTTNAQTPFGKGKSGTKPMLF